MKWRSTFTCLVWLWWTVLWAMLTATLLSQYSLFGELLVIFSSLNSLPNHIPSHIAWAKARNSASLLLLATTCYFLLCQVTMFPIQIYSSLMLTFDPLKNLPNQHQYILLSSCDPFLEYSSSIREFWRQHPDVFPCMNWLTIPTSKAISGLGWDK